MMHFAQDGKTVEAARARLGEILSRPRSERAEKKAELYAEVQAGRAGVVTINQADVTFIDLNVRATDTLGEAFAEWAPVQLGQAPVYKTREDYPTRVNMGHLGSTPPGKFYATKQTGVQIQPFSYFSEETEVPNLVNANFNLNAFGEREEAIASIIRAMRLARQQYVLNTAMNQPMNQSIATSIAAYFVTSPFDNIRPWALDPQVQVGSKPTTNNLDASAEGGITRGVFKKAATYLTLAEKSPRAFFISMVNAPWEAYWDQASIIPYTGAHAGTVNQAIPPSKWEAAVGTAFTKNGLYLDWFGMQQFVQPTNILPAGYALQATDQPAVLGWDYLDESYSNEETIFSKRAFNRRYDQRMIGLAQPGPMAPNFSVIKYA